MACSKRLTQGRRALTILARNIVHSATHNTLIAGIFAGVLAGVSAILLLLIVDDVRALSREIAGEVRVDFIDVGQGDGILITMPDGTQVVIDTGYDSRLAEQLPRYMPLFDKTIDMVVLTHHDADHSGGLDELLAHYDVEMFMFNGTFSNTQQVRKNNWLLRRQVNEHGNADGGGIEIVRAEQGQVFEFARGVKLTVLAPLTHPGLEVQAQNAHSIVIRMDYGDVSVLFTGDIEKGTESALVEAHRAGLVDLDVDILKAAHHGSKTSNTREFIDAASPGLVVIQVGKDNQFGHPSPEVIERFEADGIPVIRNDVSGTISLVTDGNRVKIKE